MYSIFELAQKYIRYYIHAHHSKGHGVHSPFVFHFIKFIKNDRKPYPEYKPIEAIRKKLLQDTHTIDVVDFGAGSGILKTNRRPVHKIAASSLKPKKFSQLFFRMVRNYHPQTIIELGTSFGISTAYMAMANPDAQVYTLEGSPAIAAIARNNFEQLALQNIELIEADFDESFPKLLQKIGHADLFYIDGNHRKAPTLRYFEMILQHAHPDSLIIFDDIHWSADMEAAWAEIKQHEAVRLSIDLFYIGIIGLKKEFKVKQHFSIRF